MDVTGFASCRRRTLLERSLAVCTYNMKTLASLSLLLLFAILGPGADAQWHFDPPKPEGHVCGNKGDEVWICRPESQCKTLKGLVESGRRITCSRTAGVHAVCCPSLPIKSTDSISKKKCAEYQSLNSCQFRQPILQASLGGGGANIPPFPGVKPDVEVSPAAQRSKREGDAFSEYGGPDDPDDTDDIVGTYDSDVANSTDNPNEPSPEVGVRGGMKVAAGEHPHTALIGFGENEDRIAWLCGGTLISEFWVVSAAHCTGTSRGPPKWVRLGELDHKSAKDDANIQQFRIVETRVHEGFKAPQLYNDIVLYRLDRAVVIDKFVAPACLLPGTGEPKGLATATGWGKLQRDLRKSELMKVNLRFVGTKECKAKQSSDPVTLPSGVDGRTMICAFDWGKDTCQGDSGGPLVLADKGHYCLHHLVGITSFGPPGCDDTQVPSTYVRVSAYIPWIESIVWPTS